MLLLIQNSKYVANKGVKAVKVTVKQNNVFTAKSYYMDIQIRRI
jgi:hypothetical protein